MAKRIANYDAAKFIAQMEPFQGSNLRGEKFGDNYTVFSYWTEMLNINTATGEIRHNERKYSRTTSKHQNYIRQALYTIGRG
jgi:hypothetical protein